MTDTPPWLDLLSQTRWAALGTINDDGAPYVSSVAFAPVASPEPGFLMHLSQLAGHTRYLLSRCASSLLIAESDHAGVEDPQTLPRLTLVGESISIPRGSDGFAKAAELYIERFPDSEIRFQFTDFHLFRFIPKKGNFVGGFGSAAKLSGDKIEASLRNSFA